VANQNLDARRISARRTPRGRDYLLHLPYMVYPAGPPGRGFGEIAMPASKSAKIPSNSPSRPKGRDELGYRLRQQSLLGEFGRAAYAC
jgi:hypothetical protein